MKLRRAYLLVLTVLIALTPVMAEKTPGQRARGENGREFDRFERLGMATPALQTPAVATRGGNQTIWVAPPPTGDDLNGDGSMSMPYATITFAILSAVVDDTIRVLPGTYNECISNTRGTLGAQKNLTIVADDWLVNNDRTTTIIDGDNAEIFINGTGMVPCVFPFAAVNIVGTGGGLGSRFEGFTVENAVSSGVLAAGSSVITNNVIADNIAREGGGVFGDPLTCTYGPAMLDISNNQILRNTADDEGTCDTNGAACINNDPCGPGGECLFTGGNGGGLYIRARVRNSGGPSGCVGGDATVNVTNNTIDSNGADSALGGGLYVLSDTDDGRTLSVQITTNVITNNSTLPFSIGYGGGGWIGTYGYGVEVIDFIGNTVRSNASTGDGGGLSAWIDGLNEADHTINITGNDVQSNLSAGGAGGLDLFAFMLDVAGGANRGVITASGNFVSGNEAQGTGFGLFPGAGGGLVANAWSQRSSFAPNFRIDVVQNDIRLNTASVAGGGLAAVARADADPDDNGNTDSSNAEVLVQNNLVAQNLATDGAGGTTAAGGGLFAFTQANGGALGFPAGAVVTMDFNTVAGNVSDTGAGGIEIETETTRDTTNTNAANDVYLNNSIIFNNSGFAAGGPARGTPGIFSSGGTGTGQNIRFFYNRNSIFMNDAGYESTLFQTPGPNDQFSDPLLNSVFIPTQCSPTIDAGTPSFNPGDEPQPNGIAFNLGHTGGLSSATRTLADPNGDGVVDGIDVLRLAVAFNSNNGDPRFDASVDLDEDDFVGPLDLSLMGAVYAVSCP